METHCLGVVYLCNLYTRYFMHHTLETHLLDATRCDAESYVTQCIKIILVSSLGFPSAQGLFSFTTDQDFLLPA
jgi:hypothetical protein